MTTRRQFLNRTVVGGTAFGLGLWYGLRPGSRPARWAVAARVPGGEERHLEGLAKALGLDVDAGRWTSLGAGAPADLVLVRDERLLDPAEWPDEAVRLRRRWAGAEGTRWCQWTDLTARPARRAAIVGQTGLLATLDLDRDGEQAFRGRDGRWFAVAARDAAIEVVEASCRHRHCQRQGRVSLAGDRLVCAPAGLLVQLEA